MPQRGKIKNYQRNYKFTDISGHFILDFESGTTKENEVYTKHRLIGEGSNKEYERLVAISSVGSLHTGKYEIGVLRPKVSQYTVWFEKERYFSQIKIIPSKKILEVYIKSPQKKWNGLQRIPFQNSRGVFCFFHQIVDCVKITGFLSKAIERQVGKMSLTIIWEGFPFIKEQYSGIDGPFSTSVFSYEGRSKEGHFVFKLSLADQVLSYHFNKEKQLEKKFWVSQGLTQEGL